MYRIQFFIALLLLLNPLSACKGQGNGNGDPIIPDPGPGEDTSQVALYATSSDKSLLFSKVPLNFNKQNYQASNTIYLNSAEKYQEMDGFGAAITGSACYNLLKMSEEDRAALLKEVFHPVEGMGYSYVRISIGCSDFSLDEYTCCDTKGIENFAIHPYDKRDLFPILKQILAINPHLKIMASPWTCPKWMKVNNMTELKPYDSWTSGQLNPRYYNDYAKADISQRSSMSFRGGVTNQK
jgi:glucosylceramidase